MDYITLTIAVLLSAIYSLNIFKNSTSLIITASVAFIGATLYNLFVYGLASTMLSSGVALLIFLAVFFTGLLTKKTTFLYPTLIAVLAPHLWYAFIPGFIINAVVSVLKISRKTGLKDVGATATTAYVNTKYGKISEVANMVDEQQTNVKVNFFLYNTLGFITYLIFLYVITLF